MSYVVGIWAQPDGWAPPASVEEAIALVGRVRELPKAREPRLLELARVLLKRYPIATAGQAVRGEVWADDSLVRGPDGPLWQLGIATREQLDQVQAFICVEANRLGLHVVDDQAAEVHLANGRVFSVNDRGFCVRALAAYWHGDKAAAFQMLSALAEHGNGVALKYLGEMYLNGNGVQRNQVVGCALLCAAAGWHMEGDVLRPPERQGALAATANKLREDYGKALTSDADGLLIRLLRPGTLREAIAAYLGDLDKVVDSLVDSDPAAALLVWKTIGKRGHARALYLVGQHYARLAAARDDLVRELAWTREAAQAGDARAQLHMGRLCEEALWTQTRPQDARGWYRKAMASGLPEVAEPAREALMRLLARDPKRPPPVDPRALRSRVDAGEALAAFELAEAYRDGLAGGVVGSDSAAVALYQFAGSAGHSRAQVELGRCLVDGRGAAVDLAAAKRLFELASRQGDAEASWRLAMLARAAGDVATARRHAIVAADKLYGDAFDELAQMVEQGDLGPADSTLAHALYLLARRHEATGEHLEAAIERQQDSDRVQVRKLLAHFETRRDAGELIETRLSIAQAAPIAPIARAEAEEQPLASRAPMLAIERGAVGKAEVKDGARFDTAAKAKAEAKALARARAEAEAMAKVKADEKARADAAARAEACAAAEAETLARTAPPEPEPRRAAPPEAASAAPRPKREITAAELAAIDTARRRDAEHAREETIHHAQKPLVAGMALLVLGALCLRSMPLVCVLLWLIGAGAAAWGGMAASRGREEPLGMTLATGLAMFVPAVGFVAAGVVLVRTRMMLAQD